MQVQYQLSNGDWVTLGEDRVAAFVADTVGRLYSTRGGNKTVGSAEEAMGLLERGFTLKHGSDWYDQIRATPVKKAPVAQFNTDRDFVYDSEDED